jgi:hypothetical protein
MTMPALILIRTDGTKEVVQVPKLDLSKVKELIGNNCRTVERIKVRYASKVLDCWMDEDGLLKPNLRNPFVQAMAEEYYQRACQDFAGHGVIYMPGNTRPVNGAKL